MSSTIESTGVQQPLVAQRLANLPVTLFAMVMGLTGMAIAWDRLGDIVNGGKAIGLLIASIASLLMVILLIAYLAKLMLHRAHVAEELKHPIRINFFPTISISLLLLSVYWQNLGAFALILFVTGATLHLLATLLVMSSWLHHSHYQISHLNPGWFIPVVGNIIVPINGVHFGFVEISWFFFSIGIVYWLVLLTVVMNRLIIHEALPPKLTPMMFILLAPPSVGFISYTFLTTGLDAFAHILYYSALFIALLLAVNSPRFWKLPFFVSSWAYSFPLAALTIASTHFAHLSGQVSIQYLAVALLIVLSAVILWLVIRTLIAAFQRQICVPE
jgi:tellurite resistance protein